VTEPELVEEIKRLAGDLSRRTTMWEHFHRVNSPENLQIMLELDEKARRSGRATGLPDPDLPPVATSEAVNAAEEAVRFPFPHLLRCLWTEVGNGGFGPGCGLLGLEGGLGEEAQNMNTVELYLSCLNANWLPGPGRTGWPEKLVVVCEWGCQNLTAVDCSTPQGEMVDLAEVELYQPRRRGMTFAQWMEAWVKGEDLWPWDDEHPEEGDEV
jgi:hypothetical protein